MSSDDLAFLQKLRSGDRLVIKSIYEQSFHYCAAVVLNNNGQMDDARDIFQEALMVLIRQTAKPDFELTCTIRTYLYSVMRNLWLKQLSKNKKEGMKLTFDDDQNKELVNIPEVSSDEAVVKEQQHEAIASAMEEIGTDCRDLLLDFYFKKIDLGTIAKKMNYTYAFVKVKKNRCMKALKKAAHHVISN